MKKQILASFSALLLVLCFALSGCGNKTHIFDDVPGIGNVCNADAIFKLRDNWYYSTISGKRDKNIEGLFAAMYPQYVDIFGEDAMSYKPVIIYDSLRESDDNDKNDGESDDSPYTSPHGEYTVITLRVGGTIRWARTIYQLSHEMTHYAFFSLNPDVSMEKGDWDDTFSGWNEEIICEAMSLYMLNYMSEKWAACSLSRGDPDYRESISEYLQDEYSEGENSSLKHDTVDYTDEEFRDLSDTAGDGLDREEHVAERNYCYKLFMKYGNDVIGEVLNMYNYYNPDYYFIDFASWENDSKYPDFVKELSLIQPEITN